MFRENQAFHKEAVNKTQGEIDDVQDFVPYADEYRKNGRYLWKKTIRGQWSLRG